MSSHLSEHGISFAAVLAWTAHLDYLNDAFVTSAGESNSSMENKCWSEELCIGIRVIRNSDMRTLADQYTGKDCPDSPALSNGLVTVLAQSQPQANVSSSIKQILENMDDLPKLSNPLEQDAIVFEKLYITLKTAIIKTLGIVRPPEEEFTAIISKLLASYLSSQQPNLNSGNAFEGVASDTAAFLKGNSPAPCEWKDVFPTFSFLVEYHINLLSASAPAQGSTIKKVSQLREKANNLMATTCYPQALQVYTDGIHACDHTCRAHFPQLYTNRAIAYIGLNCFPEAVSDLQSALQYDRTFVPAWTQLGYCQLYLGNTMLALKCYLAALRSLSGEVYPYNYPVDEALRHEYTEAKASTLMPQFVQKLVSSLILAVTRAEQQRESNSSLQEITTRVRAILARLQSHVQPDEIQYLAYAPDADAELLQSSAVRADTVQPSILSPDVAQHIRASANVEASAVTFNGVMQPGNDIPFPIVLAVVESETTSVAGVPPGSPPVGFPSRRLGHILNPFDEVVGDVMQTQHPPQGDNAEPINSPAANQDNATAPESSNEPTNTTRQQVVSQVPQNSQTLQTSQNPQAPLVPQAPHPAEHPQNPHHAGVMEAAMRQNQAAVERMPRARAVNIVTVERRPIVPNGGTGPQQYTFRIVHSILTHPDNQSRNTQISRPQGVAATQSQQHQDTQPSSQNRTSPGADDTDISDQPDLD
ncbi:hypothetical protein JCM33374_g5019 [Metschnikowia sp. JCM 33374]|nr:hypothetical protein JCM33374_g5019 [Metschnikowia sp. JCM 33374]